jgi:hypothetical protein
MKLAIGHDGKVKMFFNTLHTKETQFKMNYHLFPINQITLDSFFFFLSQIFLFAPSNSFETWLHENKFCFTHQEKNLSGSRSIAQLVSGL